MQDPWSKADMIVKQEDLAKSALACLHRSTQAVPSGACTALKQECEVYHRLNIATASAKYMQKLQECLLVYRAGCP